MRKTLLFFICSFLCLSAVEAKNKKKNREYDDLWMQLSLHKSWEKVNWNGNSFLARDGKQTKNLLGSDLQIGYNPANSWGVWLRSTFLGGKHCDYPLIMDGIDQDKYHIDEGDWSTSGEKGRTLLSVGASYSYERGKLRIIPKIGIGGAIGNNSKYAMVLKELNGNDEYVLTYKLTRTGLFLDTGLDVNYKIFGIFYVNVGLRFIQNLTKYEQERHLWNEFTKETETSKFKSKLPNQLALTAGLGLSF